MLSSGASRMLPISILYRDRFKAVKREEEINQQSQELVELRKNYASESEKVRVVTFLSFFFLFFRKR